MLPSLGPPKGMEGPAHPIISPRCGSPGLGRRGHNWAEGSSFPAALAPQGLESLRPTAPPNRGQGRMRLPRRQGGSPHCSQGCLQAKGGLQGRGAGVYLVGRGLAEVQVELLYHALGEGYAVCSYVAALNLLGKGGVGWDREAECLCRGRGDPQLLLLAWPLLPPDLSWVGGYLFQHVW